MQAENIKHCPTCGQSVNIREIQLTSTMVVALAKVWRWCIEKGKSDHIKREEFKHLFNNETWTANFAYWKDFAPSLVSGEPSYYNFNLKNIAAFLAGKMRIPTLIRRNPLANPTDQLLDLRSVRDIPSLTEFLNDNRELIIQYVDAEQPSLMDGSKYESDTRRGIFYTVRRESEGGRYVCDCEGFKFRQDCKHVKAEIYKQAEASQNKLF